MLNEFGHYVKSNGSPYGRWVESSEILALDVSNPAAISELTHFDVPGSIADSRIVGDALYLVTYENGYCWSCNTLPSTIVTSFNVAGAAIAKVDQLAYSAPDKSYSGWQRSVSRHQRAALHRRPGVELDAGHPERPAPSSRSSTSRTRPASS